MEYLGLQRFQGSFSDALCNGVYLTPSRRASDHGRLGVVFVSLTHGINAVHKWTLRSTLRPVQVSAFSFDLTYPCIHQVTCLSVYIVFVVHFLIFFNLQPLRYSYYFEKDVDERMGRWGSCKTGCFGGDMRVIVSLLLPRVSTGFSSILG